MPATKKKAAPAVKADSAVGKATLKPVKVAKVPVVQATSKGKGMQRFKYTGKKASERVKTAGQFIGLTQALEENMGIEHKDFDRSSFTMAELMDYAVLEGHVEMRHDKDRDPVAEQARVNKQKKRIAAEYKKHLIEEGFIVLL